MKTSSNNFFARRFGKARNIKLSSIQGTFQNYMAIALLFANVIVIMPGTVTECNAQTTVQSSTKRSEYKMDIWDYYTGSGTLYGTYTNKVMFRHIESGTPQGVMHTETTYSVVSTSFSTAVSVNSISSVTLNYSTSGSGQFRLKSGQNCYAVGFHEAALFNCVSSQTVFGSVLSGSGSVDITSNFLSNYNGSVYPLSLTYYGPCDINVSALSITITLKSPASSNVICCDQSFCDVGDPAPFTQQSGTSLSGGTQPYTFQWQKSTDGSTWVNIWNGTGGVSATQAAYDETYINQTTSYRRIVNPGASQSISNEVKIDVVPGSNFLWDRIVNNNTNTTLRAVNNFSIRNSQLSASAGSILTIKGGSVTIEPNGSGTVISPSVIITTGTCTNGSMQRMEPETDSYAIQTEGKTVYPNPVNNGIINFGRKSRTYSCMDATGQVLLQGTDTDKVDVSMLAKGIYLLKLDDRTEKVIIQ